MMKHVGLRAFFPVALLGAAIACAPPSGGGLTQRLSVATGGTGGVYYPFGGGVARHGSTFWAVAVAVTSHSPNRANWS